MTFARVVFDCNTHRQALASPEGPASRCVQLALDGKIDAFLSPTVLDEIRDVASRPKVVARLRFTSERKGEFLTGLQAISTILAGFPEPFVYARDPDDAHYVNLAVAAKADLIVSRDKDLLDLVDPTRPEAAEFQSRFPRLRILDPPAFLRELGETP
jgi:putative PIN family toxin of toxin-antitoxin system